MKTSEIRKKFLDFFASKGHQVVPSSSLIPGNDPTLMFTVAGMVQFKDVFLGFEKRDYTRATTSQKCLRAGGKHNDLENVGYTARHHTFFEMLGNFSFGDYFKRDAITFAWEFLTGEQWLALPKDKLMVTVYATDDEAYDIWHQTVGLPADKIVRIGDNKGAPYASDNFWTMGDTGPCGPCTEIFFDHGPSVAGGPPGSPDEDGDRFMEIWNNVFMQFNRDEAGTLHPLPKPSVDTGMGLERLSTVLQHVKSNYETDALACLVRAAARETGVEYSQDVPSLKVIADHIRACSFMVADGILPSNEGRGYVLRRIARRAIRHGYKLGQKGLFFHKIVADLVAEMGEAYPELREKQAHIEDALRAEEIKFAETLEIGMGLVDSALEGGKTALDGDTIFKLYDTFGFPVDLTADICRERGIHADLEGFERAMEAQRERGRAGSNFKMSGKIAYDGEDTRFHGYDKSSVEAKVLALYKGTDPVDSLSAGDEGIVVLDGTAFYAEGGGQVGDVGEISAAGGIAALFDVADTQKIQGAAFGHKGKLARGALKVGDAVTATIDLHQRQASARNHSATHLLHAALRHVLGGHVVQKGSLVNPERTRFDFAHGEAVTAAQIAELERVVNHVIAANYEVKAELMSMEAAQKSGAMMLFGEKYGDEVRVLTMGDFSAELCGGTHVKRTGDIGLFKIVAEGGVAAGVRRIEAVTGEGALAYIQAQDALIKEAAAALKAQTSDEVLAKIAALQDSAKALEKELAKLKGQLASSAGDSLADAAADINGVKVLAAELPGADNTALRETLDKLKDKLGSAAIVLAAKGDGKVALVAGVTADLTGKLKAGELVNFVAQQVGGKGGGRPDMAQAGGTQPENLDAALNGVQAWVAGKL
ncbi:alanine--tRNA ligase [Chromobacterium violaceum]|uniref:Alanine--tRNA ligase n=1 Tax=Chromobacterium violaceum (strain ATCC 12472 / DSM 30191 / JCM 1249 / CCUG 213 / NBRC 12614 / NCIMB 9131 / NCTC 9757 / MK) TaxID=243365 RepID=SYA_CHRVO|nr:alanine--tRNA ligase [Chromobacterium violaceum]Q7NXM2.1 RecName: Full=Alanine--tRNA ligase; AltName: Full=Alanyl-tRNA synthetase; Short=AlaRS [Chromobacterium violaceum ATCC 12472]AAQ59280.2 alanyl-tRNA synthetase [Chromobacterium violaceum ATCC 12472]MBT2867053.1 alanine--tRNA ligase [Chromobacterium violaceum]MCD0491538.1 alanine--tRNA ligase [Chromobacterium violaceum]QIY78054.1 alanine--tRNA ligase [Chromobacterium violaceum]SUX83371.1 Alanine--tRNA ligase [Chromobacterium violaceum]